MNNKFNHAVIWNQTENRVYLLTITILTNLPSVDAGRTNMHCSNKYNNKKFGFLHQLAGINGTLTYPGKTLFNLQLLVICAKTRIAK